MCVPVLGHPEYDANPKTSFIEDCKYFHANALEHGRNTNFLLDSSILGGFVLALRMVFS